MERKDLYQETLKFFLGPVESLLNDPDVSEVMINGHETIFFEKAGRIEKADLRFPNPAFLTAAATNIAEYVNREVGPQDHSMDARLPDGSRVHVIVPPASRQGVCITIRKFRKASFDLSALVQWNTLTEEASDFLRLAVLCHKNTIISGGTGSGKTSLLNALSACMPDHERIIVIEDSSELQLSQPHTLYLEAQPGGEGFEKVTIRDLFVDSLRMRPDRIVVGEVRRGEALDLIQSMISGHDGALTTVHATTPRDAAIRLETLSMMSDISLPVHVARMQVASAIQLVVQIARFSDGSRHVTAIAECEGVDAQNNYLFRDLFRFQGEGRSAEGKILGELRWTGQCPTFSQQIFDMGLDAEIGSRLYLFQPAEPSSLPPASPDLPT
ncbi:CpaF family protein [Lignipirellula cremea]|uniref:Conjugal transfer protein n=1 Tax=Lignipirellula cremea TaxID=2528010 RepID=A0A518E1W2_9BACT|nr:ATPase, T2SS/T4P/T4SS family [Lignipirellula cremea]QDU98080.1 Putative conjugal transfer protein [Lignipirellula cremea]